MASPARASSIREAKQACHVYVTKNGQIEVPDHKTRLAAVALDLAYREGKPVERTIAAHGDVKSFPDLLRRLQECEAYRALENTSKESVQGKDITPMLLEPQLAED